MRNKLTRTKRAVMRFMDNADPDQPAHLRRLIRVFVARLQNQLILYYMSKNRECPDETARMRIFIWTFAIRIWHMGLFPMFWIIHGKEHRPIIIKFEINSLLSSPMKERIIRIFVYILLSLISNVRKRQIYTCMWMMELYSNILIYSIDSIVLYLFSCKLTLV